MNNIPLPYSAGDIIIAKHDDSVCQLNVSDACTSLGDWKPVNINEVAIVIGTACAPYSYYACDITHVLLLIADGGLMGNLVEDVQDRWIRINCDG